MRTIAAFHFVSSAQYVKDTAGLPRALPLEKLQLPRRATRGAAGYDFVCPADVTLGPGERAVLPTGMRAEMQEGWVLLLFPRSSLGFKHRLMLCNTVGVIDSDYFHADNEGHILVKVFNGGNHAVTLRAGERFCQGVFVPFGLVRETDAPAERVGGIGSTGK